MRILLTGATSFTGYWFAKSLSEAGHDLVMPIRGDASAYEGRRGDRARALASFGRIETGVVFGDDRFLDLAADPAGWDLLAHHAAEVRDYHSPDFDVASAVASNTNRVREVLGRLRDNGCRRILATGSVFEGGEGAGSDGLPSFSPYGLSKSLSWQVIEFHARAAGFAAGKFVIPNPFGPFEEPRFTAYLMKTWHAGQAAGIRTPEYVRDNIHVDLLAKTYVRFAEEMPESRSTVQLSPSGYIESQATFAERFAAAMRSRLDLDCRLEYGRQEHFDEPRIRIGTTPATSLVSDWSEDVAWDAVAQYYAAQFEPTTTAG
jgi:UDP-glucose 4-epimerase